MGSIRTDLLRTGSVANALPTMIDSDCEEHYRRLERLLFVYASISEHGGYSQGFNELAVVFYHVSLQHFIYADDDPVALPRAEAAAFFMMQQVLGGGRLLELYATGGMHAAVGAQLIPFERLLERHFPRAAGILRQMEIPPVYYSLRWFSLLFSQEHDLASVLMIWDRLFAHFSCFREYLYYVGLGHMTYVEGKLNPADSSRTMHAVKHLEVEGKAREIIDTAEQLWAQDHPKSAFEGLFESVRHLFQK
jgi:hypothetical protein